MQAIENEYRVANTEVIAGENDLTAEVNHLGARIRLNYGEVYWNSRLQTEHRRIVHQFKPLQVGLPPPALYSSFALARLEDTFFFALHFAFCPVRVAGCE